MKRLITLFIVMLGSLATMGQTNIESIYYITTYEKGESYVAFNIRPGEFTQWYRLVPVGPSMHSITYSNQPTPVILKCGPEQPQKNSVVSVERLPVGAITLGGGLWHDQPGNTLYSRKPKPKKLELTQHNDGRWFEIKKDPWILMSLPAQQNVDTIWYQLKEIGRTRGRITLD